MFRCVDIAEVCMGNRNSKSSDNSTASSATEARASLFLFLSSRISITAIIVEKSYCRSPSRRCIFCVHLYTFICRSPSNPVICCVHLYTFILSFPLKSYILSCVLRVVCCCSRGMGSRPRKARMVPPRSPRAKARTSDIHISSRVSHEQTISGEKQDRTQGFPIPP